MNLYRNNETKGILNHNYLNNVYTIKRIKKFIIKLKGTKSKKKYTKI